MGKSDLSESTYQIKTQIPRSLITFIRDNQLGKVFSTNNNDGAPAIDANGTPILQKTKIPFSGEYQATVIKANLPDLFSGLTHCNDLTLICGYPVINGKAIEGPVTLLSEKRFQELYPDQAPPFVKATTLLSGAIKYELTRTKNSQSPNFEASNFLLIDFDIGIDAPPQMQIERTEDIIAIFTSVAACFHDAMCVETFSSSSGIFSPSGEMLTPLMKRHVFFQVIDAKDIPRFVHALQIKLVIAGFFYFSNDKNGEKRLLTLFDPQAISPERLCYEAAPTLRDGLTQRRPAPRLLGSKLLDTKALLDPTPQELEQYANIVGRSKIGTKPTTINTGIGTPNRVNDLQWDMEIKLDNGTTTTPKAFKESGMKGAPCHSPFRDDKNPSAKIGLDDNGNPYIYDAATHESHFMAAEAAALEGELVDPVPAVVDGCYEEYKPQDAIAYMNERYAIVLTGNKCMVMELDHYDHARKCLTIRFFSHTELAKFLGHMQVNVGNKLVPLVSFWMNHKDAIRYSSIVFDPITKTLPANAFNLFRGLACKPKRGSWRKFMRLIFFVICNKNKKLWRYVLYWIANLVQGGEKPGVALVLIGKQGTGKGTFATILGELFGRHFLHITQSRHLTGNFNFHMREAYLVFADESFWAGDKQGESVLKGLITEPTHMLEQKGIDPIAISNFMSFIFATNNDWSVPAGPEERRYCAMEVSDREEQNHPYFAEIREEMLEQGGLEGMLYDLSALDLSAINLRQAPSSSGLSNQKYHSDIVVQFLIDHIDNDYLQEEWDTSSGQGVWVKKPWGDGRVTKDNFYDAFVRFAKKAGHNHPIPKETFGKRLKIWIDGLKDSKITKSISGFQPIKNATCYKFPPVADCKSSIDKKLGTPWDWTQDDVVKTPDSGPTPFNPFIFNGVDLGAPPHP